MIFPRLKNESIVQVGDKTRIDAGKTFVTAGSSAVTKIEIEPESGVGYFDVTTLGYLDYVYASETTAQISLLITAGDTVATVGSVSVVSAATDNLFSTDQEMVQYEGGILQYVREGRDSFIDKHRAMRDKILDELASNGITKDDGTRYVPSDIVDIEDFRKWSLFGVFENVFEELSNQKDDVFDRKRDHYKSIKIEAKKRATLSLDSDGDGAASQGERINILSNLMVRR